MSKLILGAILGLLSFNSFSWDGSVNGNIKNVDVVTLNGNNYGFRVTLIDSPPLCDGGSSWAYLNQDDGNYQTSVSVLLAAKMADRKVTIYSNKDSSTGYCHIGYVVLY